MVASDELTEPHERPEADPSPLGGSAEAFGRLVDPYRRELLVHCYRMLGSVDDAEDAVQEALVSAWRGRETYVEDRSRFGPGCTGSRRTRASMPSNAASGSGVATSTSAWVRSPTTLLDAGTVAGPEARFDARESVSLAFLTALQVLPPRQRAVLILRDVLSWRAAEVASLLDCQRAGGEQRAPSGPRDRRTPGSGPACVDRRAARPGAGHSRFAARTVRPGLGGGRRRGARRAAPRGRGPDHAAMAVGRRGRRRSASSSRLRSSSAGGGCASCRPGRTTDPAFLVFARPDADAPCRTPSRCSSSRPTSGRSRGSTRSWTRASLTRFGAGAATLDG